MQLLIADQLSQSARKWFPRLYVACVIVVVAFVFPLGAVERRSTDEMRDLQSPFKWRGNWMNNYKKHVPGRQFPWEYTNIEDKFEGDFAFSVKPDGTVEGWAEAIVSFRFDYDGCASAISSQNACVNRCKGHGEVPETRVKLTITGQTSRKHKDTPLNPDHPQGYEAEIVHLKLMPTEVLPINNESTCVGASGTTKTSSSFDWFCLDNSSAPCSASGHFLEADVELVGSYYNSYKEAGGGGEVAVKIWRRSDADETFAADNSHRPEWSKTLDKTINFAWCLAFHFTVHWGGPVCDQ